MSRTLISNGDLGSIVRTILNQILTDLDVFNPSGGGDLTTETWFDIANINGDISPWLLNVGGDPAIYAILGGKVSLYYNGVEKLQTTANGIQLSLGADISEFSTDGSLSGDSDTAVPTEKAVKTYADTNFLGIADQATDSALLDSLDSSQFLRSDADDSGTNITLTSLTLVNNITEFSTDGSLSGDSDTAVPTEKAVKTYADTNFLGIADQAADSALLDSLDSSQFLRSDADDSGTNITLTSLTLVNNITEFSTDGSLSGDSDTAVPTEKAVKSYVDGAISSSGLVRQTIPGSDSISSSTTFAIGSAAGNQTLTLPSASTFNQTLKIVKSASGGTLTIARAGSDTISGLTSISLTAQYETIELASDGGTTWFEFW